MTPRLIISLLLGLVVCGVKADSIEVQSLQKITMDTENTPSYPQFLFPNSRLRVLIDPADGQITTPEAMPEEMEVEPPLPRSLNGADAQSLDIIKYPDGTISMALDKRHLKYLSVRRCVDPDSAQCQDKDVQISH